MLNYFDGLFFFILCLMLYLFSKIIVIRGYVYLLFVYRKIVSDIRRKKFIVGFILILFGYFGFFSL